jgi:hypothetical protein
MQEIRIIKHYETIEELNHSEEFNQMWEGFKKNEVKNYPTCKFSHGFLTSDGTIYAMFRIVGGKEDGLNLLNKISTFGCISDSPFMAGFLSEDSMSILVDTENGYDRCKKNRELFANIHKNVNTSAFVTTSI